MEKVKLSDIAEIFNGFSFRTKVENDPLGDLHVIQMRDITADHEAISFDQLFCIQAEQVPIKYYLQKGDVLIIAKGNHNKAIVYDLNLPKAAAASAFFVIRTDPTIVDAYFLAWLLNQTPIQQYFDENRVGTSTANINKKVLLEALIELPEKKIQKKIAKINYLIRIQYLLSDRLVKLKSLHLNNLVLNKLYYADKKSND